MKTKPVGLFAAFLFFSLKLFPGRNDCHNQNIELPIEEFKFS